MRVSTVIGLFLCVACAAGCPSGGGGPFRPLDAMGGGGDGAAADLKLPPGADLKIPPGADLKMPPNVDLASPPDLTVVVDLAVPPDLTAPPDLAVPCLPGHYVGPLMATVTVSGIPFTVTGTADFMLDPPQGQVLNISQGRMSGTTQGGTGTASADLNGTVDCSTRKLNGTLSNGKATYSGLTLPFTGTAQADYDTSTKSLINGTLTTMGITGSGTWSAAKQ